MDFPLNSSLNSSLVLALAVTLWLLWVGPYFFRRPAAAPQDGTVYRSTATTIHPPASPGNGSQGNIMQNTSQAPSGGGSLYSQGGPERPAQAPGALRIRTGRTVLAAVGLIALLTIPVGGVLAAFTSVSWLLPLAGLTVSAAVVATLRSLALRDRRRRMENAFRAAMGPLPQQRAFAADSDAGTDAGADSDAGTYSGADARSAADAGTVRDAGENGGAAAAPRETVLFDLEAAPAPDSVPAPAEPAPAPFTAEELRTEALKVAAAAQPAKPGTTPWQPVDVPKPVYVDAPKAERPAPEPIVLPEPPRSLTKTPLRPGAVPAPAGPERQETGKINLDDVLQRRRA